MPSYASPRFTADTRLILQDADHLAYRRGDKLIVTAHVVLAAAHHLLGPYGGHAPRGLQSPLHIELNDDLEAGTYDNSTKSSCVYAALQGAQLRALAKGYQGIPICLVFEQMFSSPRPNSAMDLLEDLAIPYTDFTKLQCIPAR